MKSVEEIIEARGGWDRLMSHPVKVEVGEGFMPLCIEHIGPGPRGGLLVSIAHYYEQHGDLMADPDLVVEVIRQTGEWLPVSFRQDNLGIYQETVTVEGDGLVVRSKLVDDLRQFMRIWDQALREQGFVAAAGKPT
jgi:hypothetical protein